MQHFSEVYPQDGGENQPERNYVTVTYVDLFCVHAVARSAMAALRCCVFPVVCMMSFAYRERKCADTIGTVLVPWAGHFQC